jgi:FkbM family methyltransferase
VDPSDLTGFYLYYEREYDDYIFEFLAPRLCQFARSLDIGANIGIYTLFLAARVPHLDAFEPEPIVRQRLKDNLALNGQTNVAIHEVCVGEASGRITFMPPTKGNWGMGHISVDNRRGGVERTCICLDDFFQEPLSESCLIKMDIEGAEWFALQGARRVLSHPEVPLAILVEVHPERIAAMGGSLEELRAILEGMGLRVRGLARQGLERVNAEHRFWWAASHHCQ